MQKPSLDQLKALSPESPDELILSFQEGLPKRYFRVFKEDDYKKHLQTSEKLTKEIPFQILVTPLQNQQLACTIISYNYPSTFMSITGILGSMGFDIREGHVFTFKETQVPQDQKKRTPFLIRRKLPPPKRTPLILDYFVGQLDTVMSLENWVRELHQHFKTVFHDLDSGKTEDLENARRYINQLVADRLRQLRTTTPPVLYPMTLSTLQRKLATRITIVSQNTPFFLYSLASSFALNGVTIDKISIKTQGSRIEDEFDLRDTTNKPITDTETLDRLKLSIILTKQFTYFLDTSPNPYDALSRFSKLVDTILDIPKRGEWLDLLSDPSVLKDFAKLLGTSDFLWEDFIRSQYESLLPIFKPHFKDRVFYHGNAELPKRFRDAFRNVRTFEEKKRILNDFKDKESYYIDLNHILGSSDFREFSAQLTSLAELIIRVAVKCVYKELKTRYGTPRSVGGLETRFAVHGLGKLGGASLGYASDIELLLVYSDSGTTDGTEKIENAEFFERFVRLLHEVILSKRDGIFQLDFRLRPYGKDGPMAVSLESFCRYYSTLAHFYEKLALVRLRTMAGSRTLGQQIERLRDEFVYLSGQVNLQELWNLRKKQLEEKAPSETQLNAKFSPGALVDLEYAVQALQVRYAHETILLRTPLINKALEGLRIVGVLNPDDVTHIDTAYNFFRIVINGLRMLRGSAKDLFLPPVASPEYDHLARRIGYEDGDLSPAQKLHVDFETHTAQVRQFVVTHFSRESLARPMDGTVADLVISQNPPPELRHKILTRIGFIYPEKAYKSLIKLSHLTQDIPQFASLTILLSDWLSQTPDPDTTLSYWERFVHGLSDPAEHFSLLLKQPRRLEILLDIFSVSHFLSSAMIRHPSYFNWITNLNYLYRKAKRGYMDQELAAYRAENPSAEIWNTQLSAFRHREILRIAIRDILVQVPLQDITGELSQLASVILEADLHYVWDKQKISPEERTLLAKHFCLFGMGKLGGGELNYSSDIDLIAVFDDTETEAAGIDKSRAKTIYRKVMEDVHHDLTKFSSEGAIYRIDLNLRPFGKSGELVSSKTNFINYYKHHAALWEYQALLKLSPVAGNWTTGFEIIYQLDQLLREKNWNPRHIAKSIKRMRIDAIRFHSQKKLSGIDVKHAEGGIRDIEFLVQGLQLMHLQEHPDLRCGHTLNSLLRLRKHQLLPADVVNRLTQSYEFLRRIEHFLQLLDDRQTHALPKDGHELDLLAHRLLGNETSSESFMKKVTDTMTEIRKEYEFYLK